MSVIRRERDTDTLVVDLSEIEHEISRLSGSRTLHNEIKSVTKVFFASSIKKKYAEAVCYADQIGKLMMTWAESAELDAQRKRTRKEIAKKRK